jgi:hypothetical protein
MPKTLHQLLADEAKREDVSLNQYILYRLASGTAGTGERVVPALKKATPPKQAAGKSKRPSKAPSVKNKAA